MKVAFLSAEVAPLAKAGGLGDVAASLPKALYNLDIDVRIFMPFYGLINKHQYKCKLVASNVNIAIDNYNEKVSLWQTKLPGTSVCVYLIKHKFFNSKNIYATSRKTVGDKYTRAHKDVERFSLFTQAALEACKVLNFKPNIVHAQDWHTALAADMIHTRNLSDNFFINTKILYTIHNLANQGITSPQIIRYAKVDPNFPVVQADAKDGDINCMVQGIMSSDLINTVSPRYAVEILYHYQGAGLDNILRRRKKDLHGILNGVDYDIFNPKSDPYIKYRYTGVNSTNKKKNKLFLQKKIGWKTDANKCLVGLVSRLVWQKGIELIDQDLLHNTDCQFVILGTGQKEYENYLQKLAKRYPNKLKLYTFFDAPLAQQIYAASDMFLVPSRFEPCGLTQMIAMRYGSVPVVRRTGGLADTVKNYGSTPFSRKHATGFIFNKFSATALKQSLGKALKIYHEYPDKWAQLQKNCLQQDFSWDKSAKQYMLLYKKLLKH